MEANNSPGENVDSSEKNNVKEDDKVDENPKVESENASQESFKKPALIIGPRRGKVTALRSLSTSKEKTVTSEDSSLSSKGEKNENDDQTLEISENDQAQVSMEKKYPSVPYKEPSWGGQPPDKYKAEVLKSGVILDSIDLSTQSFYVIGRLPVCDIPLAHPTISRFHAILQYRLNGDEKNGPGFYLYDLESTHGTFWNGCRIRPKTYVKLKGGHMIKFGCSQRRFIIQTPPDEEEEESEYSVTQLKEMRSLELMKRNQEELERKEEAEEIERLKKEKEESDGINWGMADDADEDTDLAENPFASTNNEELFLDDPKKTLRGWFEREGHDLQYQTEEKGIGQFLCWVDLPIDTSMSRSVRAEALVKGKKKEAVIQCALEACRILDRNGVLRQATHESRKRKSRNWEEEDYYDSDEDNFLDRTGTVERKREQRMRNAGKLEAKVETYTSLIEKQLVVSKEISKIESTLKKHQDTKDAMEDNSSEDALDAFMSNLTTSLLNKSEIAKMKSQLQNLRKEEENLKKLINIAKPANLPSLNIQKVSESTNKEKKETQELSKTSPKRQRIVDNEEDTPKKEEKGRYGLIINPDVVEKAENQDKSESNSEAGLGEIHELKNDGEDVEMYEVELQKKKKKNLRRIQQRADKAAKEVQKGYEEDAYKEDYSMWLPPQNQSGDGKTSLNDKFGY